MKIGISTTMIQRGRTGVGQYVFGLLKAFLPYAQQHEFHVFILEEDMALFDFAAEKIRKHVVSERERPPLRNIFWHQTTLPKLSCRLGLDVLHIPSYRRMVWSAGCRRVATIHDLAPFHVPHKYDAARMFYGRVVVRWLARRQEEIIAVSQHTAGDIETYFGIPSVRQNVILNGIDHGRFFPGRGGEWRQLVAARWGLRAPFFLYVSRIEHPGKNHIRLIRAFELFKRRTGSEWMLALGGSDWHGAEVVHQVGRDSPFGLDIRFLGFVEEEALTTLYRAAEVMVYPSLFEGFGFPPVEAMACGCPVVCSGRGALREVVGEGARLVNPEDVEGMAEVLGEVASCHEVREKLRQAGLENARRFSWEENAKRVLAVYGKGKGKKVEGGVRRP